jgi:hypothetical protein
MPLLRRIAASMFVMGLFVASGSMVYASAKSMSAGHPCSIQSDDSPRTLSARKAPPRRIRR